MLRTTSPLNPESLASFPSRLNSNRANPYFKPLGYNKLAQGLETFANTPCSAGITPRCRLRSQVASDPNFKLHTTTLLPRRHGPLQPDQVVRVRRRSSTANVPAPPCTKQGKFKSIGRFPEFSDYLHVRREP